MEIVIPLLVGPACILLGYTLINVGIAALLWLVAYLAWAAFARVRRWWA